MSGREAWVNIFLNVLANALWFVAGWLSLIAWRFLGRLRLRGFWGVAAADSDFVVVHGSVRDTRLLDADPPQFRFLKRFPDGRTIQLAGPNAEILGAVEIRAAAYVISALSPYRKKPVSVMPDSVAYEDLNKTVVALGSPSSNVMSDLIMREPNNTFAQFSGGGLAVGGSDAAGERRLIEGFKPPVLKDYGVILKLPNDRFPEHSFFVCAGLGECGTSGAAWYLARNWRRLPDTAAFCAVVEVEIGSDESARIVYCAQAKAERFIRRKFVLLCQLVKRWRL